MCITIVHGDVPKIITIAVTKRIIQDVHHLTMMIMTIAPIQVRRTPIHREIHGTPAQGIITTIPDQKAVVLTIADREVPGLTEAAVVQGAAEVHQAEVRHLREAAGADNLALQKTFN